MYRPNALTRHLHLPIPILRLDRVESAQAAGAVMQNHMTKHIAVDAEVALADSTFVPCALARFLLLAIVILPQFCRGGDFPIRNCLSVSLGSRCVHVGILFFIRRLGECAEAANAIFATHLAGALPAYFGPIAKREQVVVASREMGRKEKGELAAGTCDGQTAHFGAAS